MPAYQERKEHADASRRDTWDSKLSQLAILAKAQRSDEGEPITHEFDAVRDWWLSALLGVPVVSIGSVVWWSRRWRSRKESLARSRYLSEKGAFLKVQRGGADPLAVDSRIRHLLSLSERQTQLPDLAPWWLAILEDAANRRSGAILARKYRILELVAEGGFSTVYRAVNSDNGGPVAVKVLRVAETERDWLRNRFEQEIAALKRLRHPGIVSFHDIGETAEGEPFVVMQYVEGVTLRAALHSDGRFALPRAARIARELGEALAAAHSEGVLHRDLKPENLMLANPGTSSERTVIIDFSIAIVQNPLGTPVAQSRAAGSLPYMAPEQLVGYATSASDVYGLALVLFEILSGKVLTGLGLGQSGNLAEEACSALLHLRPEIPVAAARYLTEALEYEPRKRPGRADEFGAAVAGALGTETRPFVDSVS